MADIIQTKRLNLREFRLSDAHKMYALNDDPEVIRYTGDPPFASMEEARNFLSNYTEYEIHGMGRWAVIRKTDHVFIGWCGLKRNEENLVDIGFRFFREEWGKGYATEAAIGTLEYGFSILKLNEIIGRVARENAASIRVLEKLGMTYWKTTECNGIPDALYYRLNKTEYFNSVWK